MISKVDVGHDFEYDEYSFSIGGYKILSTDDCFKIYGFTEVDMLNHSICNVEIGVFDSSIVKIGDEDKDVFTNHFNFEAGVLYYKVTLIDKTWIFKDKEEAFSFFDILYQIMEIKVKTIINNNKKDN